MLPATRARAISLDEGHALEVHGPPLYPAHDRMDPAVAADEGNSDAGGRRVALGLHASEGACDDCRRPRSGSSRPLSSITERRRRRKAQDLPRGLSEGSGPLVATQMRRDQRKSWAGLERQSRAQADMQEFGIDRTISIHENQFVKGVLSSSCRRSPCLPVSAACLESCGSRLQCRSGRVRRRRRHGRRPRHLFLRMGGGRLHLRLRLQRQGRTIDSKGSNAKED